MSELLSLAATAVGDGGHLISVAGEIDMSNATELAEYIVQFEDGEVALELSDVTFVDSSGLRALLAAHERLKRGGTRLVIRKASARVLRVLEIAGLDSVLDVETDR
jgi:anti-sigma B factor antagonist